MMSDPVQLAARTAWGEARGEGAAGMQAVLNTIAARVAQPGWWGHDIASVCTASCHGIHQFSCWNEEDPNHDAMLAVGERDPAFRSALLMAQRLEAGMLPDIVRGADSYFALGSDRPFWATWERFRCTRGRHAFYQVGVHGGGPVAVSGSAPATQAGREVHH
jgi:N-acetylmuramoyl-L-alanine amidase